MMSSGLPAGPLILITLPSNHYNTKLWRQSYLFEYSGSCNVMLVVWLLISDDIIFPLWSRKNFTTDEAYGKRHDVTYSHRVIVWISANKRRSHEWNDQILLWCLPADIFRSDRSCGARVFTVNSVEWFQRGNFPYPPRFLTLQRVENVGHPNIYISLYGCDMGVVTNKWMYHQINSTYYTYNLIYILINIL